VAGGISDCFAIRAGATMPDTRFCVAGTPCPDVDVGLSVQGVVSELCVPLQLTLYPEATQFMELDSLKEWMKSDVCASLDNFWIHHGLREGETYNDMYERWRDEGTMKLIRWEHRRNDGSTSESTG